MYGRAFLQRTIVAQPGSLSVDSEKIVFRGYRIRSKDSILEMMLCDTKVIKPIWAKFLGIIPLFPSCIEITMTSGEQFVFLVFKRAAWLAYLRQMHALQFIKSARA
jgi:hypothetical protein